MSCACAYVKAGSLVLQKLLVTKGVPKNCVYVGIDQNGRLCPVTYVSYYQLLCLSLFLCVCVSAGLLKKVLVVFLLSSGLPWKTEASMRCWGGAT